MNNSSELYQMVSDFTLFWLCTEKIYEKVLSEYKYLDFYN